MLARDIAFPGIWAYAFVGGEVSWRGPFFGVVALMAIGFIAQALNIPLTWEQELGILAIALVTSKGVAGVAGAILFVLAATLQASQLLPVAGIALTALYAANGWIGQWLEPLGIKVAFTPLRVAVSGAKVSPPLFESMEILGKHSTMERLKALRATL